jgi:hypothetical protein
MLARSAARCSAASSLFTASANVERSFGPDPTRTRAL